MKVQGLIRRDLPHGRSDPLREPNLRSLSKGRGRPSDPKAERAAAPVATPEWKGQKSAEVVVVPGSRKGTGTKDRTETNKEEP